MEIYPWPDFSTGTRETTHEGWRVQLQDSRQMRTVISICFWLEIRKKIAAVSAWCFFYGVEREFCRSDRSCLWCFPVVFVCESDQGKEKALKVLPPIQARAKVRVARPRRKKGRKTVMWFVGLVVLLHSSYFQYAYLSFPPIFFRSLFLSLSLYIHLSTHICRQCMYCISWCQETKKSLHYFLHIPPSQSLFIDSCFSGRHGHDEYNGKRWQGWCERCRATWKAAVRLRSEQCWGVVNFWNATH